MGRAIAVFAIAVALAPATSAASETLTAPRARQAALAAERATAAAVVKASPTVVGTGSAVDSCRRVARSIVRCATHSTYEQREHGDVAVLIDKIMTQGVVTVRLSEGRLIVRYRSR
jgi:hypothetical protein